MKIAAGLAGLWLALLVVVDVALAVRATRTDTETVGLVVSNLALVLFLAGLVVGLSVRARPVTRRLRTLRRLNPHGVVVAVTVANYVDTSWGDLYELIDANPRRGFWRVVVLVADDRGITFHSVVGAESSVAIAWETTGSIELDPSSYPNSWGAILVTPRADEFAPVSAVVVGPFAGVYPVGVKRAVRLVDALNVLRPQSATGTDRDVHQDHTSDD